MVHASRHSAGEKGLAIAMTTLVLIPLMVFAALGVDLASFYSRISALQRAADAAALAGAVYMPDIGTARVQAAASLASNGFVDDQNGIDVTIEPGSKSTSLRVTVTDTNVKRWFSQVFVSGNERLSRSAEAEYNLPLPLGSPLNYFGGDTTKTAKPDLDNWSLVWPSPNRSPANAPCNVGTSSGQKLGRWTNATTFDPNGFSGSTQCQWQVETAVTTSVSNTVGSTLTPNNVPCNRVQSPSTTLGRWNTGSPPTYTSNQRFNSGAGNVQCQWTVAQNVPTTYNQSTNRPPNRSCNVPGFGRWNSNTFEASTYWPSGDPANILCQYRGIFQNNPIPQANPIDPSRSPGFWAAIEGPKTPAYQGDAYNTQCWSTSACSSTENNMFLPTTNANRGFWYVIKIPQGLTGTVALNVYDAAYNVNGGSNVQAGDRKLGSSDLFPTQFQVYRQTNALDFTARTPLFSGSPNQTAGSCNLSITNEAAFTEQWQNICNLSVQPNDIFLLNVQTTGSLGDGVNGYALEAMNGNNPAATIQPALYALSNMGMQNNNSCSGSGCTPPPATFYLAEVGPQYAGRTLVMELWDAGDVGSGVTARMRPMRPSTDPNIPRPVVNVPAADCTYTSDTSPNPFITNGAVSSAIGSATSPHASDDGTVCEIESSDAGTQRTGGNWLRIRIQVPTTYSCNPDPTRSPEVYGNTCWWGIQYIFDGSANDVTTWQARIEGNPLQLTL